jgi:hypothetical protein
MNEGMDESDRKHGLTLYTLLTSHVPHTFHLRGLRNKIDLAFDRVVIDHRKMSSGDSKSFPVLRYTSASQYLSGISSSPDSSSPIWLDGRRSSAGFASCMRSLLVSSSLSS